MAIILVVDDSPVNRLVCSHILEQAGHQVLQAEDGLAAWQCLQKNEVQLMVSDIAMPELDGFALLERVRADKQLSGLPVILLTAIGEPEEQIAGMAASADSILSKPVSSWELSEEVNRLLPRDSKP
jgi:two-component system chemotaxis sensor kinase CheA